MARPAPRIRTRSEVDDIPGDAPVATPAAQAAAPNATPASSASAATPSAVDSQVASQSQLEALLGQYGPGGDGTKMVHTVEVVTKQIPNPAVQQRLPDGSVNPGWQSGAPPTIPTQVLVHIWTNPTTKATIKAEVRPDGSYLVTKDQDAGTAAPARPPVAKQARNQYIGTNPTTGKPTQVTEWDDGTKSYDDTQVPASATTPAKPPEVDDSGGRHKVWQPNPGGASAGGQWVDVGPSDAKYDQQEVLVNGQRHLVVTATVPGQPPTQTFYGPDGKPETALPTEAPTYSARDQVVNGKHYTVITTTPKDGSKPKVEWHAPDGNTVPAPTENPQDTPTTVTRNGSTYIQHNVKKPDGTADIYYTDQAGNRVSLPDDAANSFGTLPKGVAQFVPDYSQPDLGLTARRDQLNELVQSGQIDKQTAKAVLTQDAALADVTQSHGTALANQDSAARGQDITQRQQDIGEVASRRTASTGTFQNVFDQINQNARYLGAGGGGLAAKAFVDALDLSEAKARQVGGYQDVPQIAPTPTQSNRTIKIGKDGSVSISVPHLTPAPDQTAAPSAPASGDASAPPSSDAAPASAPSTTVAGGEESSLPSGAYSGPTGWDFAPTGANPATVSAIRPSGPVPFDPSGTVTQLRAAGVPQDVIDQAVAEHQQELAQAA